MKNVHEPTIKNCTLRDRISLTQFDFSTFDFQNALDEGPVLRMHQDVVLLQLDARLTNLLLGGRNEQQGPLGPRGMARPPRDTQGIPPPPGA